MLISTFTITNEMVTLYDKTPFVTLTKIKDVEVCSLLECVDLNIY